MDLLLLVGHLSLCRTLMSVWAESLPPRYQQLTLFNATQNRVNYACHLGVFGPPKVIGLRLKVFSAASSPVLD